MAEGINQVSTIQSNVVAIAQLVQSVPPNVEQQGATEMATTNGTNFNDNGIDEPKLVGTNKGDSIYGYAGNDIRLLLNQMHNPKNPSRIRSQSKGSRTKAEKEVEVKLGRRPLASCDRSYPS